MVPDSISQPPSLSNLSKDNHSLAAASVRCGQSEATRLSLRIKIISSELYQNPRSCGMNVVTLVNLSIQNVSAAQEPSERAIWPISSLEAFRFNSLNSSMVTMEPDILPDNTALKRWHAFDNKDTTRRGDARSIGDYEAVPQISAKPSPAALQTRAVDGRGSLPTRHPGLNQDGGFSRAPPQTLVILVNGLVHTRREGYRNWRLYPPAALNSLVTSASQQARLEGYGLRGKGPFDLLRAFGVTLEAAPCTKVLLQSSDHHSPRPNIVAAMDDQRRRLSTQKHSVLTLNTESMDAGRVALPTHAAEPWHFCLSPANTTSSALTLSPQEPLKMKEMQRRQDMWQSDRNPQSATRSHCNCGRHLRSFLKAVAKPLVLTVKFSSHLAKGITGRPKADKTLSDAQIPSDIGVKSNTTFKEHLALLSGIFTRLQEDPNWVNRIEDRLRSDDTLENMAASLKSQMGEKTGNQPTDDGVASVVDRICDSVPAAISNTNFPEASTSLTRYIVEASDLIVGSTAYDGSRSSNPVFNENSRRRIIRALTRISGKTNTLPSSLFLHNVELQASDPFFGGGYADLFLAKRGGRTVALKRLRVFDESTVREKINMAFCQEALIWKYMSHPNVLPFEGVDKLSFSPLICLVSPYLPFGNIMSYLTEHPDARSQVPSFVTQAAEGIAYLHDKRVIHGDIKGANILINEDGQACIADFGLSVMMDATKMPGSDSSSTSGSIRWMAPELHWPEQFDISDFLRTPQSDVYGFGCTMLEVFSGHVPFHDVRIDFQVIVRSVAGARPSLPDLCLNHAISDDLWSLIQQCWSQDRDSRPSMSAIVARLQRFYNAVPMKEL